MTNLEFEQLLHSALIRSAQKTWLDHPSDEALLREFPDTDPLDHRIRQLKKETEPIQIQKTVPLRRRALRHVAMFFLAVSVLFGALMLHPGVRAHVIGFVVSFYEDHIKYSFQDQESSAIPTDWTFAYLPEGFALGMAEESDSISLFQFEREDGLTLYITISGPSGSVYTDNEHYHIATIPFRDGMADVYESADEAYPTTIVWLREELGVLIRLSCDIAPEELLLIMEHLEP